MPAQSFHLKGRKRTFLLILTHSTGPLRHRMQIGRHLEHHGWYLPKYPPSLVLQRFYLNTQVDVPAVHLGVLRHPEIGAIQVTFRIRSANLSLE